MNEMEAEVVAEPGDQSKTPLQNLKLILFVGAAIVLIAGGLLVFAQANAEAGCAGRGACMIYFYTDD